MLKIRSFIYLFVIKSLLSGMDANLDSETNFLKHQVIVTGTPLSKFHWNEKTDFAVLRASAQTKMIDTL